MTWTTCPPTFQKFSIIASDILVTKMALTGKCTLDAPNVVFSMLNERKKLLLKFQKHIKK